MKHLNIIRNTLSLSLLLLLLLPRTAHAQANDYDMTQLSESTSVIRNVITTNVQEYIQWTSQSMQDGTTIIYNNEDGTEYELTAEQTQAFNQAYADGLANSTPEALTAVLLNDMIDLEQTTYEDEKSSLIEAASEIQAVIEVAEILVVGDQQAKINAEAYAVENDLTEIKETTRKDFNASIDGMLEASMTKNMIEAYAQDSFVIDTIANSFMATESITDFFTNAQISIDELSPTYLVVEWDAAIVGIESVMFNMYSNEPYADELQIIPMPKPEPIGEQ